MRFGQGCLRVEGQAEILWWHLVDKKDSNMIKGKMRCEDDTSMWSGVLLNLLLDGGRSSKRKCRQENAVRGDLYVILGSSGVFFF